MSDPTIESGLALDWLQSELDQDRRLVGNVSLPPWADPDHLPELRAGDVRLSAAHARAVSAALRHSTLDAPHPLVPLLKTHLDPHGLAAYAWRILEGWLQSGAAHVGKWALLAQGLVGDDATVMKLGGLVREWPAQRQHQRAKVGLECLRFIGSDTALMELQAIARKIKFKTLQARAQQLISEIAKVRGWTQDQLEDRVVPDCGLDVQGTRTFDYGSRQFCFVFTPQLKPMIRDEAGKRTPGLPRATTKDDPAKVAQAQDEWKLLKKQLSAALKLQSDRLKKAMVHQRRWNVEDFERFLVRHPFMTHLARLLVWGGYDEAGGLRTTFRVTDAQTYETVEERPCTLEGIAMVGVVHPYHLPDDVRCAWAELFSDYEVIQPIAQLARPVYRLEPHETEAVQFERLKGVKIPGASLVYPLEHMGWSKGHGEEQIKPFPASGVTAVIRYQPGVWPGAPSEWPEQEVTHCFFQQGVLDWSKKSDPGIAMKLGTVDALAVTEVLNDLMSIGKHGR